MRRQRNAYRLLALAGVLSMVAWGCSTDSPTAPRQENPPPQPPGQTHTISVAADPRGIALPMMPTGLESTTMIVDVSSPMPVDGTSILLTTSLGSFTSVGIVRSIGVTLVNGRAFFTLFAGGLPVQIGIATVQATLAGSQGELDVPIAYLEANFSCANPEMNNSVNFSNTSSPEAQTFEWDFGDGGTSTDRNPIHVFSDPGMYPVTLKVTRTILTVLLETSTTKTVDTAQPTCGE